MQIANPIYDVVFKHLMENERIAKFFISTILNTPILNLEVRSREFTYEDEGKSLRVFRLDFLALIETPDEPKKVLIEVQKAQAPLKGHLARFRKYLGEQYSRSDKIKGKDEILNIITIYILGFQLRGIESPCFHIERHYRDLISGNLIEARAHFTEALTHDSYCIQAPLIREPYRTRLERLLSIFEQRYFMEERILKDYPHNVKDDADLQIVIDALYRVGSDSETRRRLDLEAEAWREVEELQELARKASKLKETIRANKKALAESAKAIQQKENTIEQKDKAIEQKDKAIEQNKKDLAEKDKLIAQLRRKLGS